jgi:uncharacterized membrane protein YqiK
MMLLPFLPFGVIEWVMGVTVLLAGILLIAITIMFVKLYQKVEQGTALVRNGVGGTEVSFSGMFVFPIIHHSERMDISVKRIEIYRHGVEGLICQDNIRADIKVAFFVRVNKTQQDVMQVAQLLGCERASAEQALVELFDAKFSEALKTVGKQFDFVDLYNSRDRFKEEILKIIGTDLNGYVLDDAAIDYLEQTPITKLNPDNILDAEGIKKITDLTARQQVLANEIRREREKTITKQDVEAREAILELQRQQSEAEEKQAREVAEICSRQRAEAEIVSQQQRLRAEQARIATEEEIQIAEENRQRQVLVAQKSKERTDAVETERVEKDRLLEVTERERIVTLAQIEKDKAVEQEKKEIQDVIRDRVVVQRAVVEEEEKIKDTHELATAERQKRVAVKQAEMVAEQAMVKQVKAAEAAKQSAVLHADEKLIEADAERAAAEKHTDAKKLLAEADTAEQAASGLAEAQVIVAQAAAQEKKGLAEALVLRSKAEAEADGIARKAEAMKLLNGVGREHEEFKLQLRKEKTVELEMIRAQANIAGHQAQLVGEALKSARIDIVGGDSDFFSKIVGAISNGKSIDRLVHNSNVLSDLKGSLLNGESENLLGKLRGLADRFNIGSEDIKNLSIAALITRMISLSRDSSVRGELERLLSQVQQAGISESKASSLELPVGPAASQADGR